MKVYQAAAVVVYLLEEEIRELAAELGFDYLFDFEFNSPRGITVQEIADQSKYNKDNGETEKPATTAFVDHLVSNFSQDQWVLVLPSD